MNFEIFFQVVFLNGFLWIAKFKSTFGPFEVRLFCNLKGRYFKKSLEKKNEQIKSINFVYDFGNWKKKKATKNKLKEESKVCHYFRFMNNSLKQFKTLLKIRHVVDVLMYNCCLLLQI
jgi:hypothetical protein